MLKKMVSGEILNEKTEGEDNSNTQKNEDEKKGDGAEIPAQDAPEEPTNDHGAEVAMVNSGSAAPEMFVCFYHEKELRDF